MKKRILSILLCCVMLVGLLPTVALAEGGVSYLDETGTSQTCDSATEVTSGDTGWTTGWYVVQGTVEIGSRVTVSGDVHLILTEMESPVGRGLSRLRKGNSCLCQSHACAG